MDKSTLAAMLLTAFGAGSLARAAVVDGPGPMPPFAWCGDLISAPCPNRQTPPVGAAVQTVTMPSPVISETTVPGSRTAVASGGDATVQFIEAAARCPRELANLMNNALRFGTAAARAPNNSTVVYAITGLKGEGTADSPSYEAAKLTVTAITRNDGKTVTFNCRSEKLRD
ncbi:MAG: hypothetical protein HY078_17100 [Elusimicrobia bacterium]|nr:hypothetical protein [Elusimicrobiota bacterium]